MGSELIPQGYRKPLRDSSSAPPGALPADFQFRSRTHTSRGEQDFPFWKLTFAITTGLVFAAALIWTVFEIRARHELEQMTRQLQLEAQRQRAARPTQVVSPRAPVSGSRQQRSATPANASPLMLQGTHAMPVGTVACMYGYQAQKQHNGGWKQLLFDGKAQPCRTR